MEEKLSYRKIRSLKPHKISNTSERLFKPQSLHSKAQKLKNSIMDQNVTQYEYMLSNPHLKQSYIKWATNLREYRKARIKQREAIQYDIPSAYYKKTLSGQQRQIAKSQSFSHHINTGQFSQFFDYQNIKVSENQLNFFNSLRQLKDNQKNKINHLERFKNQGSKQNNNFLPKLLKKTSINKLRDIDKNDYQEQLDGTHKYPEYSYKGLRQKNSALICDLSRNNSNISLPCIAWQIGLRNY